MFELSWRWLVLGLDASLKAALVALLAAVVLKLFRIQDSNVRHRVWTGVLGGMLLLPGLTLIVPALRLPLPAAAERWMALRDIESASGAVNETAVPFSPSGESYLSLDNVARPGELNEEMRSWSPGSAEQWRFSDFGPNSVELPAAGPVSDNRPMAEINAAARAGNTAQPAVARPQAWRWTAFAMTAGCLLWLGGALTMALRLLLGLWTARRLLAESLTIDPADLPDNVHEPIAVRECPFIRVPLTVGCCRPQILLPPEWINWPIEKLRSVLAHERMHAARGDCAVALLAEMNCCLYWFHPLAWWLRRQLSSLAEQACDDAAIDSTGDRTQYARHLLEVAAAVSQQRGRLVPTGVSMARQSNVETRIHAILDFTRPLSRRLTWLSTLGLLAVMIPLIALAAALQPASSKQEDTKPDAESVSQGEPAKETDKTPPAKPVQPAANKPAEDATFSFAGSVVDPSNKPVAGAKLHLCYFTREPAPDLAPVAVTDARGEFRFSRRRQDFDQRAEDGAAWRVATIAATAEGFGFAVGASAVFETTGRLSAELPEGWRKELEERDGPQTNVLRLVADAPIKGRIVNIDGRPVAGAKLAVHYVWGSKDGSLAAWEQAAGQPKASGFELQRSLDHLVNGPRAAALVRVAPSDRDGWLTLEGLGQERLAQVQLTGPGIESAIFKVRGRPGQTLKLNFNPGREELGQDTYYPANFTHVAGPSQPVVGRVTDAKTGQPIAGCVVQGTLHAGTANGSMVFKIGEIQTLTDAAGRYRLEGLERVERNPLGIKNLLFLPPRGSVYLAAAANVKIAAGGEPVTRDVALHRGIRVHGQVLDGRTGKPILGSLRYAAFGDSPAAKAAANFVEAHHDHYRYQTDSEGKFEIPALPGRGVLAFVAHNSRNYPQAVGIEQVLAASPSDGQNAALRMLNYHNLLQVIDLPAGIEDTTVNLTLTSRQTITGRALSLDGQVLKNYAVYGGEISWFWQTNEGDTFEVKNYEPKEGRRLLFYEPEHNLVGRHQLSGPAPEQFDVKLSPGAVIKGRIVDADGLPLEGISITNEGKPVSSPAMFMPPKPEEAGRGVLPHYQYERRFTTDKDGRFELPAIIPGLKYTADCMGPGKIDGRTLTMGLGRLFTDIIAEPGQTKDLGDLRITREQEQKKPEPKADEQASSQPATARPAADAGRVTVSGVVLLPSGQPAAGAMVRAAAPVWATMQHVLADNFKSPLSEVRADEQGRFSISFPAQPFGDVSKLDERWQQIWKKTQIAASLKGYGPAWVVYEEMELRQPLALRLVEDLPIRGRVIDLEGRPIAGTTVKISGPQAATDEDLSAWIAGVKAGELPWTVYKKAARSVEPRLVDTPTTATTDAQGTFEIRGLGRERIVSLVFEGETVAHRGAKAVTRPMETIQKTVGMPTFTGAEPVFGSEFTFTADPARTIEGVVRGAKSGELLPGVAVESYKLVGYPYSNHRVLKTVTDQQGRFRLVGMPKGAGNRLLVLPNDEQPYFMRNVDVPDPVGLGPAKMEIELHRGIWISGRVTDKATGQPVGGVWMHYLPFRSNEFAQKTPEFDANGNVDGDQMRYQTKADGTYRLVGLPGRAIVGANSVLKGYRVGVGYDDIDAPKYQKSDWLDTYRNPINPSPKWPTLMKEINPAADAQSVALDLELDPGESVRIRVTSGSGDPLTGVAVFGLSSHGDIDASEQPQLLATNLGPKETRAILFHHKEKNLGRVLTIGPEEIRAGEATARLEPCATVVGRILREDGTAISGMAIEPRVLPDGDFSKRLPTVAADSEGRFSITLLPGCQYTLTGQGGEFQFVTLAAELSAEPGSAKDLGTLKIGKDGKLVRQAVADPGQRTERDKAVVGPDERRSTQATRLMGQVTAVDGQPVAGAFVAATGWRSAPSRGGDLAPRGEILAEATTDANGRYELTLKGVAPKAHSYANLIARKDGAAIAWHRLNLGAREAEVTLKLRPEEPIRGRFIDLEGRPAADVKLRIESIMPKRDSGWSEEGVGYQGQQTPAAWFAPITSDKEGRFTIHGIPAGHGVHLEIEPNDNYARQSIALNTGMSESRGEYDGTYRSLVRNAQPGEEIVVPLPPAQIFEGTVRYEDTKQPAARARLTVWASQQQPVGSMVSVPGQADENGRYRIAAMPGIRFGLTAHPPAGTPYLCRQTTDEIRWDTGDRVKQVDLTLPRGVLVRGKIIAAGTSQPIARVAVQYVPEETSNARNTRGILTGWQAIQLSDDAGNFEIAVVPGPGRLLAHATGGNYVLQELSSSLLSRGKPGGQRQYAHAIHKLDPQPDAEPLEVTLELEPGASLAGQIVDEQGQPIEEVLVVSRLDISPYSLWWRGGTPPALGGRFQLTGLQAGVTYPTHFLEPKRKLGATALLKAGETEPTVVLQPCGSAQMRFVDKEGQPVAEFRPTVDIVVTPGVHRFDVKAMRAGEITADSDYAGNVDRLNHPINAKSDEQGRMTIRALIPGATYRVMVRREGQFQIAKEFQTKASEVLELGDITVERPKNE
jgi:beta-lactamase regulating signal transducer with metallopeptidase domain/protocatechuate 3,4-dioxygenase beta subunit